jgi:hypothetical protein
MADSGLFMLIVPCAQYDLGTNIPLKLGTTLIEAEMTAAKAKVNGKLCPQCGGTHLEGIQLEWAPQIKQ